MKFRVMTVLMISLVLALGILASGKEVVIESRWAAAPVVIDGRNLEWPEETLVLDSGSRARYGVQNDGRNLYLYFLFQGPTSFTTIEFTGMKVFLGSEGKKSKDLGLRFYRKQVKAEEVIAETEKRGGSLTPEQRAELLKKKVIPFAECEVINKKKVPAPSDPAVRTEPPAFQMAFKGQLVAYEFRIPLSRVNEPGGLGVGPGQTVKLGFEWGGMVREAMQSMGASRSEMSTRAAGGSIDTETMLRGGIESGVEARDGGMDTYRDPRFKQHAFWVDVKLASR